MRFQRILEELYFRPSYITASGWNAVHAVVRSRMLEPLAASDRPEDWFSEMVVTRSEYRLDQNGIAHVELTGPIGKRLSALERACGATGIEELRADFEMAAQGSRGLFLKIDSPGGTVTGTPENAQILADLEIPVVVYTEDTMASAAYFIGAGADEIWCAGSADVGSIGVIIPWVDKAGAWEEMGVEYNPIISTGSDLKGMGFGPVLTAAQREFLQADVDRARTAFVEHVLRYRAVDDSAMRGQCVDGEMALQLGLVDAIGSQAEAYEALLRRVRAQR